MNWQKKSTVRCTELAALAAALVLAGCAQTSEAPPPGGVALAAPGAARNWDDFQRQAALRIVAAAPAGTTYAGDVPAVLLAIPVIEVELHADGRVKSTKVLRHPTQAADTAQLAIDAVRRAGPYGDVSRLPKPWKFVEVFLFDDDRRFKPRTLDD